MKCFVALYIFLDNIEKKLLNLLNLSRNKTSHVLTIAYKNLPFKSEEKEKK